MPTISRLKLTAHDNSVLTRVTTGLNDYRYVASMHIEHPTIDTDSISRAMPIKPERVCHIGELKQAPNGAPLAGRYDRSHWYAKLETPADGDVCDFLHLLSVRLENSRTFLAGLADSGGKSEIFIGMFADRGCDFELPSSLLADLAAAGLSLRFDYYGPDDSRPDT